MNPPIIELKDVKSKADATIYLTQQCLGVGLEATLYSYIFGVISIPLVLRRWGSHIKFMREYQVLFGATSMMVVSYFIGTTTKAKCEERVKKELHSLVSEK